MMENERFNWSIRIKILIAIVAVVMIDFYAGDYFYSQDVDNFGGWSAEEKEKFFSNEAPSRKDRRLYSRHDGFYVRSADWKRRDIFRQALEFF